MGLPTTGETFSGQTAAVQANLGLTTTIIPISTNVTTSPLSRKVTLGVLVAFLAATGFAAQTITAAGFAGPLTGNVTGNVSGSSGSTTGNAATATLAAHATALATPRNINGVPFDGTADITITAVAAAGSLTGTTLAATVVTSSLTAIGTLTAGAVPASLVTAATFPGGDFSFTDDIAVNGLTLGRGSGGGARMTTFGFEASQAATSSLDQSVAIGSFALQEATDGLENTVVGDVAGSALKSPTSVSIFGGSAGGNMTSGQGVSIFGAGSMDNMLTATNAECLGVHTMLHAFHVTNSVAIGAFAVASSTGSGGTFADLVGVGFQSLANVEDGATGDVALGPYSGLYETSSNAFYVNNIDQTDTATEKANSLLYGTFGANAAAQTLAVNAALTINGTLQLGTTYAGGVVAATGTIPIMDSTGTVYHMLVHT